jgi:hypothetical protein
MVKLPDVLNDLGKLIEVFKLKGCTQILSKVLAENDNSKNQVYFGPGFSSLNLFPNLDIQAATSGSHQTPIFKASVRLSWLGQDGSEHIAPGSQLIFYPQYPEVRFSGFLQGCDLPPSGLMKSRLKGRVLFLGIREDGHVFGVVVGPESPLAREYRDKNYPVQHTVFAEIPLNKNQDPENLDILLDRLKAISDSGWIKSRRLDTNGLLLPCESSNCGGYTLEALLGVKPNGYSEPDFLGWEIKQYNVTRLENLDSGVITLMTPEPKGGVYRDKGVEYFVREYGYLDLKVADRLNFGGIHYFAKPHLRTNLTMVLNGYESGKITDSAGYLGLVDSAGRLAAAWYYSDLLTHWNRKHNRAAYIPSTLRSEPERQYRYGHMVRLCRGTDFSLFLKAIFAGQVYYDPGIKVEHIQDSNPVSKRRSQFRIKSRDIPILYNGIEIHDLDG